MNHKLISSTDYTFHAYGRTEGVCGIIISDHQVSRILLRVSLEQISASAASILSEHDRHLSNAPVFFDAGELTPFAY
jgi:phosphoenolpyruvate-protein kinase (PTS system EI component)